MKKKAKKSVTRLPIRWLTIASVAAVIEREDRRLVFVISDGASQWTVLAIEGTRDDTPTGFLDQHSHDSLGSFKSLHLAMEAVESFARKWFLKKTRAPEDCGCGTIKEAV